MRESYGVTELSCVLCGALQIYLCIHEKSHNYTSKENSQLPFDKARPKGDGHIQGGSAGGRKDHAESLVRPQDLAYMLVWGETRVC